MMQLITSCYIHSHCMHKDLLNSNQMHTFGIPSQCRKSWHAGTLHSLFFSLHFPNWKSSQAIGSSLRCFVGHVCQENLQPLLKGRGRNLVWINPHLEPCCSMSLSTSGWKKNANIWCDTCRLNREQAANTNWMGHGARIQGVYLWHAYD